MKQLDRRVGIVVGVLLAAAIVAVVSHRHSSTSAYEDERTTLEVMCEHHVLSRDPIDLNTNDDGYAFRTTAGIERVYTPYQTGNVYQTDCDGETRIRPEPNLDGTLHYIHETYRAKTGRWEPTP